MKNICVIGSLNMDLVVNVDTMPKPGQTIIGSNFKEVPGGKGANQAVAMARLNGNVSMIGKVGEDGFGQTLINSLKNDKVDTTYIQTSKGATGVALITVDKNAQNSIVVSPGANFEVKEDDIDNNIEAIKNSDIVVLQLETPLNTIKYALNKAKELNKYTILNPAPAAEVPMEVVEKVTYLTPNEHEAVLIFGNELSSEELLKKYAGKLLITQGSKGVSTCLETGEILTVPARPAKVVDTTGAGDTLNGAFSVQIANGADIKTALTFANTAASLSTEKFGAQTGMPTVSEVEKELQ